MRCARPWVTALLLCALPIGAGAAADAVRAELQSRIARDHPGVPAADFALGAAAFDPELRAKVAANAEASAPALAEGKALWNRKFKNGRTLSGCFPNGGRNVAGAYPLFDARQKRVTTLEVAINQCLKSHGEALLEPGDASTMGAVMAYARSLSAKQKIAVRVPPAAEERFEAGRRLYYSRLGQRNYACASCHVQGAGKRYDGEVLSAAVGQAAHAPVIRDGKALTLQVRMRECLERMGVAPFPAGSDELNHLEYFLTVLSNGLPLQPNAWRER